MPGFAALTVAALLSATAAARDTSEAYSPEDVLVAFAEGCDWALDGPAPPSPAGGERVWATIEPSEGTEVARLAASLPAAKVFAADLSMGTVYLFLSARQDGGRNCQAVDFDAPEQIALNRLVPWAGRQPDGQVGDYGQARWGRYWAPGLFEGHVRTEIYHVPASSPLVASAHLRGLVLTTSTGAAN